MSTTTDPADPALKAAKVFFIVLGIAFFLLVANYMYGANQQKASDRATAEMLCSFRYERYTTQWTNCVARTN
jgi:hypothetical protein